MKIHGAFSLWNSTEILAFFIVPLLSQIITGFLEVCYLEGCRTVKKFYIMTPTMFRKRPSPLLIFTIVSLFLPALAHADFQAGKEAYDRKDYGTALKEWQSLADQGLPQAQHKLGLLYFEGQGISRDYQEALRWNLLAAEQGLAEAQHWVGITYYNGYGVPKDDGKAAQWFRQAAEQGNFSGQLALGVLYLGGRGVPKDFVLAYMWLNLAASQDDEVQEMARILRDELEKKVLAPEDISQAQKLSREWLRQHKK